MQLVQQLLHLLTDSLVVIGQPDDCIPVHPDSMDIYICAREALQKNACRLVHMSANCAPRGDQHSAKALLWGKRGPTSLSIKLSCIPGCPGALRRPDLSLISASKAALCCCSLFSSALTVSMMQLSNECLYYTGSLEVCLLGACSSGRDLAVYVMLFRKEDTPASVLRWPAATVNVACYAAIISGICKLPWRSSIASTAETAQPVHKHKIFVPELNRTVSYHDVRLSIA